MAFAAVYDDVPARGWILFALNLLWVMAYDTEYAMVDRDDDVKLGLKTSAITFGRFDVAAIGACYVLYLAGMAWYGQARGFGTYYFAGVAVAAALAAYHMGLIRGRDRDRCFRAFRSNHWLGFALFAGVVLEYALRQRAWPHEF
jgi:4-hydroxybenzoate polyprenyltransferase